MKFNSKTTKIFIGIILTITLALLYYQKNNDPWFLYMIIPLCVLGILLNYFFNKYIKRSETYIDRFLTVFYLHNLSLTNIFASPIKTTKGASVSSSGSSIRDS